MSKHDEDLRLRCPGCGKRFETHEGVANHVRATLHGELLVDHSTPDYEALDEQTQLKYWFHDPMCNPIAIRQRAWRYCNDDLLWFERLNRIADVIEQVRQEQPLPASGSRRQKARRV